MANFVVQTGSNVGTVGNDTFTVPAGVGDFSIAGGSGFDTLLADISVMSSVSWSFGSIESVVYSGSQPTIFITSYGATPKTVDASAVTSLIYMSARDGTQNHFIGSSSTVVSFHSSAYANATQSTLDFNTGKATLTRPGDTSVEFTVAGDLIYSAPPIATNIITGSAANNRVTVDKGTHTFNGGGGLDTAYIEYTAVNAAISDFSVTQSGDNLTVQGSGAASEVRLTGSSVERVVFVDENEQFVQTHAFDVDAGENAGSAYRVYQAAFARTPDNGGLKYWIGQVDAGTSLIDVAKGFIASAEFQSIYGANPSNADFVSKLYQNVLGREGEAGGLAFWVGELDRRGSGQGNCPRWFL